MLIGWVGILLHNELDIDENLILKDIGLLQHQSIYFIVINAENATSLNY